MQMSEVEKSTYTMPVMIDRTEYTSKPESSLVGKIKRAMVRNGVVYMTMRQVFDALISGQSIIPARLEGGKGSENWKEQSLFMVDFDGGVSLAETRERYEDAGLYPTFAYYTFSHSEACEKFRLVFVMDDAIRNASVRDKIMATLIGLSGGAADAKCIDRARYFNGTNQGGEYYGDTVEVSDVLSLWDDSYAALLPSKGFRKFAREKSATARENGSKPSGRSYEVEVSGNVIPFSTWHWRINAKHNLAMLNRFFGLRRWVEGDHRERFAFIYYNQAKLIYEAEEALALVQEKVAQMEEPLSKAEIYWAISHTEKHEETNMPELHGDGVFLFNRETIASEKWLDMTKEEEESCGIFRTREKNARADRNRDVKRERNELVASLFEAGKTPCEIKDVLDKQYGELSLSVRSIQRLCAKSKECDRIPQTIYNITPSLPQPTQANGNGGCKIVPIPANTLSPSQKNALDAILNGKRNILLTGVAGSGKSYILKKALEQLEASGRSVAVCAATGMAASNFSSASTFHRLFHMDADGYIYKEGDAMAELVGYDVVIVDEASMIKASHMEKAIDLLKETRKRYHKAPRLVLCFDIMQLPPVDGGYFFEARNFGSLNFECHYLMDNMRQNGDIPFTRALNFLRVGENIASCCRYLNAMCSHVENQDAVHLYAKREKADAKNLEILRRLPGEDIDLGNLVAKVGCEVLITENSRHDNVNQYYNGQRGVLEQVQQNRVCVRTRDGQFVWLHKKVLLDGNGNPVLDNNGQPLRGYPLSLAYAVTIHKSQGMTLDKANIDPDCFADGQLYVALSRVRSMDGIHLLRHLRESDCKVSENALAFDRWMRAESSRAAV